MSCQNEIETSTDYERIIIDPNQLIESDTIGDFFEKIRYVPLETSENILVGGFTFTDYYQDKVYIQYYERNEIYIFSKTGKHIRTISSQGKGPQEYIGIGNFTIDPFNNKLILVDSGGKKLMRYSLDGNYVDEVKLDFFPRGIYVIDSKHYALKKQIRGQGMEVITICHTGEIQKTTYRANPKLVVINSGVELIRNNKLGFYTEFLNDTVYQVSVDTVIPYIYFDFMDKKLTAQKLAELTDLAWKRKWPSRLPKNLFGQIISLIQTDNNNYLSFFSLGHLSFIQTNRKTEEIKYYSCNDRHNINDRIMKSISVATSEGEFMGIMDAIDVMEITDGLNIDETSNPVLLFLKPIK
jgi:hypothetical protein